MPKSAHVMISIPPLRELTGASLDYVARNIYSRSHKEVRGEWQATAGNGIALRVSVATNYKTDQVA